MLTGSATTEQAAKPAQLPSAFLATILLVLTTATFWMGGAAWLSWVSLVALITLWAWSRLVGEMTAPIMVRVAAWLAGLAVVGIVTATFVGVEAEVGGKWSRWSAALIILPVVLSGLGSALGRGVFPGSPILPRFYRETWPGVAGGMIAAAAGYILYGFYIHQFPGVENDPWADAMDWALFGFGTSLLAQIGRMFVCWISAGAREGASFSLFRPVNELLEHSASVITVILGYLLFFAVVGGSG